MGIYARYLCPCLIDWVMAAPQFAELRPQVLRHACGSVFEIGFGSGHNLPYYPRHVAKITTADPNVGLNRIAQHRILASPFPIETHILSAEHLPIPDHTFDTVVSTWTLCSIAGVEEALSEVRRVLKPDGRFLFVEHGLADDPRAQWWQHALTPVQRMVADGCHLNRDIKALISNSGFRIETLENFRMRHMPKWAGYQYKGVAVKV